MITETKEAKYEALTRIILDIRQGGWAKIFMPANFSILSSSSTACGPVFDSLSGGDAPVGAHFFEPLEAIVPQLTQTRECPDLPDADWLALGTLRVLHEVRSGRGFLQEVAATLPQCPDVCQFIGFPADCRLRSRCRRGPRRARRRCKPHSAHRKVSAMVAFLPATRGSLARSY